MTTYELFVPAPGVIHDIRPRSAIVGELEQELAMTHYEGGGASNVQTFEEKINHAAGRRKERYPTVAQRGWRKEEIVAVGRVTWDETLRHWVISEITDEQALRNWVGDLEPLVVGGSPALRQHCAGRQFGKLTASQQMSIIARRMTREDTAEEVLRLVAR